jgi:hypothetical protein
MLEQGVWAEIKVGGEHLRLFSEESALEVQASVYNLNSKNWIAPSESVDDIEQGRQSGATCKTVPSKGCQLRATRVNVEAIRSV